MPIALKLATEQTPQPWQSALPDPLELDYAREALPTAQPPSLWRSGLRLVKGAVKALGWGVGAMLTATAFALLVAAPLVRLVFAIGAGVLLGLRRLSLFRLYRWLRYRGEAPYAQVA